MQRGRACPIYTVLHTPIKHSHKICTFDCDCRWKGVVLYIQQQIYIRGNKMSLTKIICVDALRGTCQRSVRGIYHLRSNRLSPGLHGSRARSFIARGPARVPSEVVPAFVRGCILGRYFGVFQGTSTATQGKCFTSRPSQRVGNCSVVRRDWLRVGLISINEEPTGPRKLQG